MKTDDKKTTTAVVELMTKAARQAGAEGVTEIYILRPKQNEKNLGSSRARRIRRRLQSRASVLG